jgi:hypothetical protein
MRALSHYFHPFSRPSRWRIGLRPTIMTCFKYAACMRVHAMTSATAQANHRMGEGNYDWGYGYVYIVLLANLSQTVRATASHTRTRTHTDSTSTVLPWRPLCAGERVRK